MSCKGLKGDALMDCRARQKATVNFCFSKEGKEWKGKKK